MSVDKPVTEPDMKHRLISPASYTVEPWKNGLGSTDIIAEQRIDDVPGRGWDGFIWRLARTEIPTALPFSDHSGYERHQVVIAGQGLFLDTETDTIDLSQPFAPVRYDGALKIVSRLADGPVEVLNFMVERRSAEGSMTVLSGQDAAELPAGTHLAFAIGRDSVIDLDRRRINVPEGSAVELISSSPAEIRILEGRIVLSTARLRHRQV